MNYFSICCKPRKLIKPKCIAVCSVLFFAIGCQNSTLKYDLNEQQKIYIHETTKNYGGLIELYKQRLQRSDTEDTRYKLAQIYYLSNDFEAAKRVLSPVLNKSKNDKLFVLYGHVESRMRNNDTALAYLDKAIAINPKNGEAYNVKGIVLLKKKQYDAARYAFNLARENFYDENKVTNNLAMLAILNKDYTEAYKHLNILYTKGYRDQTILHNLFYTLVKLNKIKLAKSFCLAHKLSNEPEILIQELKQIEPDNAIKFNEITPAQSDNQKQYSVEKVASQQISKTEMVVKSEKGTKIRADDKSEISAKLANVAKLGTTENKSKIVTQQSNVANLESVTNTTDSKQNSQANQATPKLTILAVRSGEHGKYSRITLETDTQLGKNQYLVEKVSPTEFKLSFYDVNISAERIDYIINQISRSDRDFASVTGNLTTEKTLILQIKTKQNSILKDFYAGPNSKGKAHCFAFDFYLENK
ncbi:MULTISPECIES: tetratricopeptide repeat protein [unclassified Gilliamella]|uniref:tetratricopeptide repeat protein n=1 Tax=unclassified Gilliamella TaxID=2685620 RepID=UPI00080EBCFC|nr:tetratricopeptide repeat protein [Gilliamella apicola]